MDKKIKRSLKGVGTGPVFPCPDSDEFDALHYLVGGGYCPRCASFDEEGFRQAWHAQLFIVVGFLRRFSRREHAAMGDPTMAMVASEIWLYNVGQALARHSNLDSAALKSPETRRRTLPKCNTHGIALSLNLPYETVRRKILRLIELGWVHKADNGQLSVTAEAEAEFESEFNVETMRDFISTARTLFATMGLELAPTRKGASARRTGPAPAAPAKRGRRSAVP